MALLLDLARSFAALTLGVVICFAVHAQADPLVVQQGGIARWSGLEATACGMHGRRYPAVSGTCYYPADIRARVGKRTIALWDRAHRKHVASLEVQATEFPSVTVELPPSLSQYIDVSAADRERARKEAVEVEHALKTSDTPPAFTLPLGRPAATMPKSQDDFGSERTFNGVHKSLHTGRDYPVSVHSSVRAVAAGQVTRVADDFYTGNSVYIDHGGGLVSMVFHLESVAVKTGDHVRRGQLLGKVGATGRATGPHLHLGFRWIGQRVDPALLLADPGKLPSVTDSTVEAEEKIEREETKEPPETDIGVEPGTD